MRERKNCITKNQLHALCDAISRLIHLENTKPSGRNASQSSVVIPVEVLSLGIKLLAQILIASSDIDQKENESNNVQVSLSFL